LVGFFIKYIQARAMFIAAIISQILIFVIYFVGIYNKVPGEELLSYLMLNFIGVMFTITFGLILEKGFRVKDNL
jgi:hypothetical protein